MCPCAHKPKEFACFSYDSNHEFHLGAASLKWYYPPQLGADLSKGYEQFVKHDDSADEHLDSLLKTIMNHEKETGKPIDAHVVTWRGMMTKVITFYLKPHEERPRLTGRRSCRRHSKTVMGRPPSNPSFPAWLTSFVGLK
jgi:hypothetical protein